MDIDEEPKASDAAADKAESKEGAEAKEGEGEGKEKAKEKEPSSYTLTAPCRVVPQQVKHVIFPQGESTDKVPMPWLCCSEGQYVCFEPL